MRPYAGKAGATGKAGRARGPWRRANGSRAARGPAGRRTVPGRAPGPVVQDRREASAARTVRAAPDPVAHRFAALGLTGRPAPAGATGRLWSLARAHAAGYGLLPATVLDPAMPLGGHLDRDLAYRAAVDDHLHRMLAKVPHHTSPGDPPAAPDPASPSPPAVSGSGTTPPTTPAGPGPPGPVSVSAAAPASAGPGTESQ